MLDRPQFLLLISHIFARAMVPKTLRLYVMGSGYETFLACQNEAGANVNRTQELQQCLLLTNSRSGFARGVNAPMCSGALVECKQSSKAVQE